MPKYRWLHYVNSCWRRKLAFFHKCGISSCNYPAVCRMHKVPKKKCYLWIFYLLLPVYFHIRHRRPSQSRSPIRFRRFGVKMSYNIVTHAFHILFIDRPYCSLFFCCEINQLPRSSKQSSVVVCRRCNLLWKLLWKLNASTVVSSLYRQY